MKAIVMAGGEGTRLRPLTEELPKPMVKLFDRPCIRHITDLLVSHGFSDICLTLKYNPKIITDYFENDPIPGVKLTYNIEKEPLGTAGGVKACEKFIGNDDFLVISGDCVCDFDLTSALFYHRRKNADVTILLYKHPHPLEYGLAETDEDGRILSFSEKPSWESVYTDRVNTGVYIISNSILKSIPENTAFDFGRELFPKLLDEGKRIFGYKAKGYWCDIGSVFAYMSCCKDALEKKIALTIPSPEISPGVYSSSPIPSSSQIEPPVYIGKCVSIGENVKIGPFSMIYDGSLIESGAKIYGSVINGAHIKENCEVNDAYIGKDTIIGKGASVNFGVSIGDRVKIGDGARISQGIRIYSDVNIAPDTIVSENITHGDLQSPLTFTHGGKLMGEFNVTITPETGFKIGSALSSYETAAIAYNGGNAAKLIYDSILCGILSAGGKAALLGKTPPSGASFACSYLSFPVSVTVSQKENSITLTFTGENGHPLTREKERKIESALTGTLSRVNADFVGNTLQVPGLNETYVSAAVRCGRDIYSGNVNTLVHVHGKGDTAQTLRDALSSFGCTVVSHPQNVLSFFINPSGTVISAISEKGEEISPQAIFIALCLLEIRSGCKKLALPYNAPSILEEICEKSGVAVLRCLRDGEKAANFLDFQPYLKDGIFAAVRLCAHMASLGKTISQITASLPPVKTKKEEVMLSSSRAHAMERLSSACTEFGAEFFEGIKLPSMGGWAQIVPVHDRPALKIKAEASDTETANEICCDIKRMIEELKL